MGALSDLNLITQQSKTLQPIYIYRLNSNIAHADATDIISLYSSLTSLTHRGRCGSTATMARRSMWSTSNNMFG